MAQAPASGSSTGGSTSSGSTIVGQQPVNSGGAPASDAGAVSGAQTTASSGNWWDNFWSSLWGEGSFIAEGPIALTPSGDDPFSGLWSNIGAGLEAGSVSFLKDIWNAILGPLEIAAGLTLWIIAALLLFKDDLLAAARIGAAFL
jgi:hypothetical protein